MITFSKPKLPLGANPTANLLPPMIKEARRTAALHRTLSFGVILVVGIVLVAILAASGRALISQSLLSQAQDHTSELLAAQDEYSEVRQVLTDIEVVGLARQVGASTEIDWMTFVGEVQATLPAGVVIQAFTVTSGTPVEDEPQATVALQGERVATLTFTATSPGLPNVETWLAALKSVPGYEDASPGSVALTGEDQYTANITMHINHKAYSLRFAPEEEQAAAEEEEVKP